MRWDMYNRSFTGILRLLAIGVGIAACHLASLLIWPAPPVSAAGAIDPTAILRAADHARGNLKGVTWEVRIESVENGRATGRTVLVKSRGYDFLGEFLDPPKYKGEKLLMVSGNMWFSKPGLSKPIPISRRQRLMGQAANGDIAATNYADEYEATVLPQETVNGERCHVFDLRAREKQSTYDRIRYWVSCEREVGVQAEYFTVSGHLIKTAVMVYDHTVEVGGRNRPFISRLTISDAIVSTNTTTLAFRAPRFQDLPDHVFNLNLLNR